MSTRHNRLLAAELHNKVEFFILALTFGALSVFLQTVPKFSSLIVGLIEVGAWVLFLISGITGIVRLIWGPVVHTYFGDVNDSKELSSALKQHRAIGSVLFDTDSSRHLDIESEIGFQEQRAQFYEDRANGLNNRIAKAFRLQLIVLVLGFVCVATARGLSLLSPMLAS